MNLQTRYDILFEPVKIGPVTAKNRFYQVPHCNGMGHRNPRGMAAMRGVKAQGGWSVICTEICEIHPSGEMTPDIEARLWDDHDIPALQHMVDAVHSEGALAGIQLGHPGNKLPNLYSREIPLAPSHIPILSGDPVQGRAMDKSDIRDLRKWHRDAALRAKKAGFDLIYVYAAHAVTLPMQFLSRQMNHRTDEYGGSLENRARLLREILEETIEAVGDKCAVPLRISVDELLGPDGITSEGEGRELVEMLAEIPDLWDVNISGWANDSGPSRFFEEGSQERYTGFVKSMTSKPVVGVGRFTSPDMMVSQIRRGVMDMIGAARPSIADPFLPLKVQEGRIDDIRECIGCNMCVSGDTTGSPIRCTQNPTMGEEWRKNWHPEVIPPLRSEEAVLVVGAGPSGLECARALAQRGAHVILAEARDNLGGRVAKESNLPGLNSWRRVIDYRIGQIQNLTNVEYYLNSNLSADEIIEFGFQNVVVATGSRWVKNGLGRVHRTAIPISTSARIISPEEVMEGVEDLPESILVYDDDHYYLAGAIAEKLRSQGCDVNFATPAPIVSQWTVNTLEQTRIQSKLMKCGVKLHTNNKISRVDTGQVVLQCTYSDVEQVVRADAVVLVTSRLPNDKVFVDLMRNQENLDPDSKINITRVGDVLAPGTIAAAVYSGHRFAREFCEAPTVGVPFGREIPNLAVGPIPLRFT